MKFKKKKTLKLIFNNYLYLLKNHLDMSWKLKNFKVNIYSENQNVNLLN